jgi:serine/threonine protein kinase
LKTEVDIHSRLKHSGIVEYIGHFQTAESYVIILELCRYGSLYHLLEQRMTLTEPEVQFFMLQVLDALEHIHSKLVIHRDIKPENIFLQEGMKTKIGDFGLSTNLDNIHQLKK